MPGNSAPRDEIRNETLVIRYLPMAFALLRGNTPLTLLLVILQLFIRGGSDS